MSMDDIHTQMNVFETELEKFNNNLKASMADLRASHDQVAPLWQDEMRRTYERRWTPLEQAMNNYVNKEGQDYVDILRTKLNALRRYLRGT